MAIQLANAVVDEFGSRPPLSPPSRPAPTLRHVGAASAGAADGVGADRATISRRVVITGPGETDKLVLVEGPLPVPGPGEFRIKVEAAGLSWGDVMMRRGIFFGGPLSFPMTPGYDVVGRIDALGEGASGFALGSRVAALTIMGGCAEHVCVPEDWLVPVPEVVDSAQASAVTLNYATAYQMLHRHAKIGRGASVLIHGAAGGVGSALLDLGRAHGAKMFGTASTAKLRIVESFGAIPIDYKKDDVEATMHRLMPDGVDVVFDSRAGATLWESRRLARHGGRVVTFGISDALRNGRRNIAAVVQMMLFLGLTRVWPGPKGSLYAIDQVVKTDRASIIADTSVLFEMLEQGLIRPLVHRRFRLDEIRLAHEILEARSATGKLVIVM